MENKKVLLSIKDLYVRFRVRGRILTAIRGISLDIYENECIAIVGESGSGKSVFTKTFAGMLDSNGFIDQGSIVFNDEDLADTKVPYTHKEKARVEHYLHQLNVASKEEFGAATYRQMLELEHNNKARFGLTDEEDENFRKELDALTHKRVNLFNEKQTYDSKNEKDKIADANAKLKEYDAAIEKLKADRDALVKSRANAAKLDTAAQLAYETEYNALKARRHEEIQQEISAETIARNEVLAKEIQLSIGRFSFATRNKYAKRLIFALHEAMKLGVDLNDEHERNKIFDPITFRVKFLEEVAGNEAEGIAPHLHGVCILNLASFKSAGDWMQVRGTKIATVFQDPMTSLNPILTIGKQISSIIMKHQNCSAAEARVRAIEIMAKVGIPNPETRLDDYPFQYSGGMRQRIVIAIALSCQPKILICDEPTTALDVTIQAQILQLIKDLQKEFNFTTVFITHDLGVVANVADRVAVLYAGQLIELGKVEEVFYDSRHPYTWALLSSLPQLAAKNTQLYSITGTPPSLYNEIKGDAFAPRNPYCLKIDTLLEPPMFKVTDTHFAKSWLCHPDAPKVERPEIIQDIHEKILSTYNLK